MKAEFAKSEATWQTASTTEIFEVYAKGLKPCHRKGMKTLNETTSF